MYTGLYYINSGKTHIKKVFFSGRKPPPPSLSKNNLFSYKSGFFSTKNGERKKSSKSVSGYYKIEKKV